VSLTVEDVLAALSRSRRPANSPGWGKLVAVKSGVVTSKDGRGRCVVHADTTYVVPEYRAAREHPELWRPADKRDTRTVRTHLRSLAHTRQELERSLGITGARPPAPSRASSTAAQSFHRADRRSHGVSRRATELRGLLSSADGWQQGGWVCSWPGRPAVQTRGRTPQFLWQGRPPQIAPLAFLPPMTERRG
jgi:hypothetical protein